MNNNPKAIPLDEMDDAPDWTLDIPDAKPKRTSKYKAGITQWKAEERAAYAFNQERAPRRALAHTLQLVNDLLGDVGEGDGDPATFATLTILVGALGKLSRI